MSPKYLAYLPTLLFGFLISSVGFSAASVLRLERMSPVAGSACEDYASKEGQRLKAFIGTSNAGFAVTDTRCTFVEEFGDNENQWNVEIAYEANVRIPVVSTYDSHAIDRPGFDSLEECKAAMQKEQEAFKRLTKLNFFASYCRLPLFRHQKYEVQLIGFGVPALAPYSVSTEIFGSVLNHTIDSFKDMVKTGLASTQAELMQLSFNNGLSYLSLAIRYYGPKRIILENTSLAFFPTYESCLAQVSLTNAALKAAGASNIGTFCQKEWFRSGYAELSALTDNHAGVFLLSANTLYDTYASCEIARPAVVEHYKKDLKRDIKIGYCSSPSELESRKFQVVMLEKR